MSNHMIPVTLLAEQYIRSLSETYIVINVHLEFNISCFRSAKCVHENEHLKMSSLIRE